MPLAPTVASPPGLVGYHSGWSPLDPTSEFVGGAPIAPCTLGRCWSMIAQPTPGAPGKSKHFIPSIHADVCASKRCVLFGHVAILLECTRARGLCPVGPSSLGELHLEQLTWHYHILCKTLGIQSIPQGHHNHFCTPCHGTPHLFYLPIHPLSALVYWIRSRLWHCCSQGQEPPKGPGWVCLQAQPQSLGLGSCSSLGDLLTHGPPHSLSVGWSAFLGSSPSRNWVSQLPGEETGLDNWPLDPGSVCACNVPGNPDSFPNLGPFCAHSLSQCCHGMKGIHHNSSVSSSWKGVYSFWSGVPSSWTCATNLATIESCLSTSAFGSGIDQDSAQ